MMEWNRGFQTRLDAYVPMMEARIDAAEMEIRVSRSDELTRKWRGMHNDIQKAWQALAEKSTPVRSRSINNNSQ